MYHSSVSSTKSAFVFTDTLVWCKLNTTGQNLPPRAGHTTIAFGKNLFVFGGFANDQSLFNDVYVLDVGMLSIESYKLLSSFPVKRKPNK